MDDRERLEISLEPSAAVMLKQVRLARPVNVFAHVACSVANLDVARLVCSTTRKRPDMVENDILGGDFLMADLADAFVSGVDGRLRNACYKSASLACSLSVMLLAHLVTVLSSVLRIVRRQAFTVSLIPRDFTGAYHGRICLNVGLRLRLLLLAQFDVPSGVIAAFAQTVSAAVRLKLVFARSAFDRNKSRMLSLLRCTSARVGAEIALVVLKQLVANLAMSLRGLTSPSEAARGRVAVRGHAEYSLRGFLSQFYLKFDFHASELDGRPALWDELRLRGVVQHPVTAASEEEMTVGVVYALANGYAGAWAPLPVGCS